MNKFDFTPTGVEQAKTYLYNMDQSELEAEIRDVQLDLRSWILKLFFLDQEQIDWMNALDDHFVFQLSAQLALTMSFKQPFRLVKPGVSDGATVLGVKRGESHNPIETRASSNGSVEAEGELIFTITY